MSESKLAYLFYDGECGMCHFWVKFILKYSKNREIVFAPIGQSFYQNYFNNRPLNQQIDSIIFVKDEQILYQSTAVLEILKFMGNPWRLFASIFKIIPQIIRDLVYDFIAKIRKKVFKTPADYCPVVPEEHRKNFKV